MKKNLLVILFVLLWAVGCKDDAVQKCAASPTVAAGDDITLVDKTSTILAGTTTEKEGTWSIVTGKGGLINGLTFTGELKTSYTLKWESTNECGTSSDEIVVTFNVGCGTNLSVDNVVEKIHWIQQACFRIETSPFTIYTDPHSITKKDTADIILISHAHDDHFRPADIDMITGAKTILIAPEDVKYSGAYGKRIILKPGDQYTAFGCVSIKAVPAYNITKTSFHPKGNNWVGYLITMNGVTIYHAGDTERIPEMKTFTCDLALLPLGQTYTFDTVADAAEAAKDVKAKIAIPMHFGLAEGTAADALSFKNMLNGIVPVVIKEKGM